jgi:D-alanine-D-alanine ligase
MKYKNPKICILGGGWSNERLISLKSSNDVFNCLKSNGHDVIFFDMVCDSASELETFLKENSVELVFNLIHGEGGEDGTVQSYLDSFGIAYCGSNTYHLKFHLINIKLNVFGLIIIFPLQIMKFITHRVMIIVKKNMDHLFSSRIHVQVPVITYI